MENYTSLIKTTPVNVKMVGNNGSMLQELYTTLTQYEFSDYINYIVPQDGLSLYEFQQSPISSEYYMDTKYSFDEDGVKDDMLFELFGNFSNDDTITVRANMISEVKSYQEWYECASFIRNIMKSTLIESWLNIMKYKEIKGDEISLHAQARIYQCHVVVYIKTRPWTMVKLDDKVTESRLTDICDVHLLYMGKDIFIELKRKPNQLTNNAMVSTSAMSQDITIVSKPVTCTVSKGSNIEVQDTSGAIPDDQLTDTLGTNTLDSGITVLTYGPIVFPTARQILPLHPHLSDSDSDNETSDDYVSTDTVETPKTDDEPPNQKGKSPHPISSTKNVPLQLKN